MILGRREVREGIELWLIRRSKDTHHPIKSSAIDDLLDELEACTDGKFPWEVIKEHDKLTGPLWSQF